MLKINITDLLMATIPLILIGLGIPASLLSKTAKEIDKEAKKELDKIKKENK